MSDMTAVKQEEERQRERGGEVMGRDESGRMRRQNGRAARKEEKERSGPEG